MGNNLTPEDRNKKVREKFDKKYKEDPSPCIQVLTFHNMEKDDYIASISDAQIFKQKYLIPHYKLYNILQQINGRIRYLRTKNLSELEIQNEMEYLWQQKLELAESRLEVFFCNVFDSEILKDVAKVAYPFGLLHTGLLVDDIVIEWGRGLLGKSVVNPSLDVRWDDFIFSIELENKQIWEKIKETYDNLEDYILNKKDLSEMGTLVAFKIANNQLDVIASASVIYNSEYKYHLLTRNCQNFVTDILKEIHLDVNKDGDVGKVLKIAQDKYKPFDFSFRQEMLLTRQDLDRFVMSINFTELSKDERRVLFCYRNVFEFYERNKPNDEKYKTTDDARYFWKQLACQEKFGYNDIY